MKTVFSLVLLVALAGAAYFLMVAEEGESTVWGWFSGETDSQEIEVEVAQDVDLYRKWTNNSGKTLSALFISRSQDTVTLLKEDDEQEYTIAIHTLSSADQDYLSSFDIVHTAEEEISSKMQTLAGQFPETITESIILSSGTRKYLAVEERVYLKYQGMFQQFQAESLSENIRNVETWIERDTQKWSEQAQSTSSAGYQAAINHHWVQNHIQPYLHLYRQLL